MTFEPDETCEICGQDAMNCSCPVCPVCGVQGRPECAAEHNRRPVLMADQQGLYNKYRVIKVADGEEVKDVFVLRPSTDPAARAALFTYAAHVRVSDSELADDLLDWLFRLTKGVNDEQP